MMRRAKNSGSEEFMSDDSELESEMSDAKDERAAQGLAPEIEIEVSDDEGLGPMDESSEMMVEGEIPDGGENVPTGDAIDPRIMSMFSKDDLGKPGMTGKVASKIKAAMDAARKVKS